MNVKQIVLIGTLFIAPPASEAGGKLTYAKVQQLAAKVSRLTGVDASLLTAIAHTESSFNAKAVGRSHGEIGLMQLRPEFFGEGASFDPFTNMLVAALYLKKLETKCAHYGKAYFVCYNVGPYRKLKHPKLHPYYKKVLKYAEGKGSSSRRNSVLTANLQ